MTLFDEVGDIPTPPERIDPGGTPLPPAAPAAAETSAAADRGDEEARDFVPGLEVHAPSGAMNRALANLEALAVLNEVTAQGRAATAAEQDTLARWSGWGAVPQMFEPHRHQWAGAQKALREVLSEAQYREAAATTLNAHYTDPAVAHEVWGFLQEAGFTGGRVLEPGSGAGTFIGQAPGSASMVGVELDSVTARISALLYPSAQVRNEGFETTRVPENSFVATVGNVPFGKYAVHDPAHNPHSHSIHNHFILKSLALTAPGGYVAVLSSRYTLDAANPRARQEVAATADLVGAVRLPTGAFSRVAGTEVVTDLIVLRKRGEGEPAQTDQRWVHVQPVDVLGPDGETATAEVNGYFAAHPDRVLGQLRLGHGQFGADELIVRGPVGAEMTGTLRGSLALIHREARAEGLALTATAEQITDVADGLFARGVVTAATAERPPVLDTLRYDDRAQALRRWDGQGWVAHPVGAKKLGEFRELLALRDTTQALIGAHSPDVPRAERDQLRGELNRLYDDYVRAHGPINRFKWTQPKDITTDKHDARMAGFERTWRTKEGVDGVPYDGPVPEEIWQDWDERAWTASSPSKRFAHLDGGIRDDPGFATVAMLEVYDEETQTARKAPMFAADILSPPVRRTTVDTVGDAVAISLDESGAVDLARVAELLGSSEQEAQAAMAGVVFRDTTDATQLIPAARYLSGNVRMKLAEAEAAQERDGGYAENVAALREVIPRTIEAPEIEVRPGVPWIPTEDYATFVREVLGADRVTVDYTQGSWTVNVPGWQRTSPLMTDVYGTGDYDAAKLLEAVCNSRSIQVMRPPRDVEERGGDPVDMGKTFAAQAQARKLTEKFKEWVFTDETRRERLVGEYNTRFNSLRPARYDGTQLALPGLGGMVPHPHQRNAVARIVGEPTVLLDHVVGAGKTGVMFMGAMELKRLGMARQPWIVVPNHILEQVGREAKQWYPAANVLIGTNTDNAEKRRRFAAQTATADWDMVIVPKSVFTAIGVSPERRIEHLEKEAADLRREGLAATNPIGAKKLEAAVKRQEKRLKELTERTKDTGLTFEQTGCDYLFVDEAHMYKNRGRVSGVAELSCSPGAQQAEDLALKLDVLRERRRDAATAAGRVPDASVERVATFATGTPVANSLGEMWVMQKYLRPDLLEAAGVGGIDAWGATFTGTVSSIEMNASGSKLKPVTRIGRFVNVPELVTMSAVFTDVVTRDQVPAALPRLVTGGRQVMSMPAEQEVRDFIVDLAWRAENFDPKRPDIDNILKVTNDGRNVSLDPRLGNLAAAVDGGRAGAVAEQIMRIHHANKDTVYRDDTGAAAPVPGSLQIVFCDRATPNKDGRWSIYDGVRDELVARGMDPAAVRFVHDYAKPAEKARLFADCRNGRVSVLLGSTEKMGTGTNIQARAIALHHLDVPWRPADLEQREGRIIRQGNQNPEVEICNYVTEATFDTVMWQTVERKARFIAQIKTGDLDARTAEDIGSDELGDAAAATKAVATGDPRYLQQVQLDDDVKRLTALKHAYGDAQARHRSEQRSYSSEVTATTEQLEALDAVVPRIRATADAPFAIIINDRRYTERADAAPALLHAARQAYADGKHYGQQRSFPIAELRGVQVRASRWLSSDELALSLSIPSATNTVAAKDLDAGAGLGLLRRVENLVRNTEDYRQQVQDRYAHAVRRIDELAAVADNPFEHTGELADKQSELEQLTAQLRIEASGPEARAAAAQARERMEAMGRKPGYSLLLNPTPALLADMGVDPVEYKARVVREAGNEPVRRGDRDRSAAGRSFVPSRSALHAAQHPGSATTQPVSTVVRPDPRRQGHGPTR